jgi:hypothetical protein
MKADTIYLLIKVTINTTHVHIHDAIQELQTGTQLRITSTPGVEVLKTKIIPLNTKK